MSETKGENFHHFWETRRRELLLGGAAITAIGAGVAVTINARKRHWRQQGLDNETPIPPHELPLEKRLELFGFEPDSEEPTYITRLAAFIYMASRSSAEKAVTREVIEVMFTSSTDEELLAVGEALQALEENHFIEATELHSSSDLAGYSMHPDLNSPEAQDNPALQQAFSDVIGEFLS